jgi:hypothetical protein
LQMARTRRRPQAEDADSQYGPVAQVDRAAVS